MQDRSRLKTKYMGMTLTQLIVLGCLGLTLIGVIGLAVWMVFRTGVPTNFLPVQPTAVIPATSLPLPTLTLVPSQVPTLVITALPTSTETLVPYESLIPKGWKQFISGRVEIWMPPGYKSQRDTHGNLVYAVDISPDKLEFQPNVSVNGYSMPGTDLDGYVQEMIKIFPTNGLSYTGKKQIRIGARQAVRVQVEGTLGNTPITEAVYLLQEGEMYWNITCVSHVNEFFELQPVFDQIAQTFRLSP